MIMQLNHIKLTKKSVKNFQNFLIKKIKSEKNGVNIIFSDYRNGIFDKEYTKKIIKILKSKNNIIFVDQQSTTKKPDLLKFKNADYLILNEYEFRKAFKKYKINNLNFENSLKVLRKKIGINNFIIKMGKKGSSYFTESTFVKVKAYKTAKNLNTIGAGDFFLAKFATLEKKTMRDKLYEANKFAYKKISNKIKIKSIRI
jgi:bifunctional ADP-heptose synthase (sugar kinase/adenylyltransferase)